ncbi:NUDIX hydrolase [Leucobacter tenebrionis]|uniref:NUDIX hydrolase n=1 Tax=Leucobacter tenebrionis TaxID=2873270 RepID=UPI001CA6FFDB|nr:NUDIX domain-containing protein [Leucobacter tenebrionis]QZY50926.1 NUDIX domain-containing protein [Leucobacter tenebrionis]
MNDGVGFAPVYEARDGLPVRLEAAPRQDSRGRPYLHHRLVVADGRPGAVVVAVRSGEREDTPEVLLVRSLRYAVGQELWELPRGSGEPEDAVDRDRPADPDPVRGSGPDPHRPADPVSDPASDPVGDAGLRAGLRELAEETGFTAARSELLGGYVVDSTVFPQRVCAVLCEIDASREPGDVDGEVEESRWFSRDEVVGMIRSGAVADAHSLSALLLWLLPAIPTRS